MNTLVPATEYMPKVILIWNAKASILFWNPTPVSNLLRHGGSLWWWKVLHFSNMVLVCGGESYRSVWHIPLTYYNINCLKAATHDEENQCDWRRIIKPEIMALLHHVLVLVLVACAIRNFLRMLPVLNYRQVCTFFLLYWFELLTFS